MGVIRKQGVRSTFFIYTGFAFGFLINIILFPTYFTPAQFGLAILIVEASKFLVNFAYLGSLSIMVKFSPFYKDHLEPRKSDLLSLFFAISLVGYLLTLAGGFIFQDLIVQKYAARSPMFVDYYPLIFPFTLFFLIYTVFETYGSIYQKTAVPAMIREVIIRLFVMFCMLLFILGSIQFSTFINLYIWQFGVAVVLLCLYLAKNDLLHFHLQLSKVTRRLKGKLFIFGSYMYGGLLITAASHSIDSIFIGSLEGLPKVATFTIAKYFSEIVQAPYRAFNAIAAPIIAGAWKDKDYRLLNTLYKKTSINQLIASVFVFSVIWINLDLILSWIGEDFKEAKIVFLLLGLSRIVDLGSGMNNEILGSSNHWRFNFISTIVLMALFIPLNYILLKQFGIYGSALANLLAFFLYNFVRFLFIWFKYKMQPFSKKTLIPLLLSILFILLLDFISQDSLNVLYQVLKTTGFSVAFLGLIYLTRTSEDIDIYVHQIVARIKDKYIK